MSPWAPPALPTWWAASRGPTLVGREDELAAVEEFWAAVEAGVRQVVFIGGEPGAGKTRLVVETAAALERAGAVVLVGYCLADAPVAYQPFREPIRALLPAIDEALPAETRDDVRERLTALLGLPEARERPLADRATADHYDALVDLLRGLARGRPVALVLEDLHWATSSTLQLLAYLVHHLRDARLLIAATHRATAPDRSEPVVATISELYRDPGVHRLDLAGLSASAVTELVRREANLSAERAEPLASRLRDQTGGNPFFLREICRDLRADGARGSVPLRVPGTIRDAFSSRLGLLDERSAEVVELTAVLGERVQLALLLAASSFDAPATVAAVERAVEAGLLGVATDGGELSFPHALARQAVLEAIPPLRRSRHHARAGEALDRLPSPGLPEIRQAAHHFAHAFGEEMGDRAHQYLMLAARMTERALAFDEAADCYRQAAELAADLGERHDAVLRAVPCLIAAGRFTTAMEISAVVAHETTDPVVRLRAATAHEQAGWHFGEAGSAALLSDAVRDDLVDREDPVYLRALASLGRALGLAGARREALELSDSTLARARALGEESLVAHALDAGLWAGLRPDRVSLTLARARELSALAARLRDQDMLGSASYFRCTLGYLLGDRPEIDSAVADMRRAAERSGIAYYEFWAATVSFGLRFIEGDFAGAERDAEHVRRISSEWEGDDTEGLFGVQMYLVQRETGRLDPVRALITGDEDPADHWAPALLALYTELGMVAPAARLLTTVLESAETEHEPSATWPAVLGFMVEAALAVRDVGALRRLRPMLEVYQGLNLCSGQFVAMLGSADRYLACVASALGEGDALSLFDSAENLDRRTGSTVHLATTLASRALHLASSTEPTQRAQAGAVADRARALAEPIGLERVLRMLARPAEAASPRAPTDGAGGVAAGPGLTARELEVVALLVGGASNQEIAERLVISPHTAANHVRSILQKTGSANRTQAAMSAVAHHWVR